MSDAEQAAMAALLAEACAPRAPAPDWLAAFDDGLIHRLTHCTVCHGQPPWTWGILGLWQASMSYVLCERCAHTDGLRQVEKLFVRRYVATRGDAPSRTPHVEEGTSCREDPSWSREPPMEDTPCARKHAMRWDPHVSEDPPCLAR